MSRTKDEFIRRTGGFRFGESPDQLQRRLDEIAAIEQRIASGEVTAADVDRLAELRGNSGEEEDAIKPGPNS